MSCCSARRLIRVAIVEGSSIPAFLIILARVLHTEDPCRLAQGHRAVAEAPKGDGVACGPLAEGADRLVRIREIIRVFEREVKLHQVARPVSGGAEQSVALGGGKLQ